MICPYIKSCFSYTFFSHFRLTRFVLSWFLFRGIGRNGTYSESLFLFCVNGIPSCVFFGGMVQNGILNVCFYCCSLERNSESFLLRGITGILSEITICSVYSVFRGINFFVGNFQPY
jgi:hypothetical protein